VIPPIATAVTGVWFMRMSLCMSVTLVHPAEAVGWNGMPFNRDTRVIPSNIVLDTSPGPEEICGSDISLLENHFYQFLV